MLSVSGAAIDKQIFAIDGNGVVSGDATVKNIPARIRDGSVGAQAAMQHVVAALTLAVDRSGQALLVAAPARVRSGRAVDGGGAAEGAVVVDAAHDRVGALLGDRSVRTEAGLQQGIAANEAVTTGQALLVLHATFVGNGGVGAKALLEQGRAPLFTIATSEATTSPSISNRFLTPEANPRWFSGTRSGMRP